MSESILKFKLPEEQYESDVAHAAHDLLHIIAEFDRFMRNSEKRLEMGKPDSFEKIKQEWRELAYDSKIYALLFQ